MNINQEINEFLIESVRQSDIAGVKKALYSGAYIHCEDDKALVEAINNDNKEIVVYLLDKGAYLQIDDNFPLRHYAKQGDLEMVNHLVSKGAYIHANNDEPLRSASKQGHYELVEYLLNRNANIDRVKQYDDRLELIEEKRDRTDETALVASAYQKHYKITKLLIERGADVNVSNGLAFNIACHKGSIEDVELFLQTNLDEKIKNGSAVINATNSGNLQLVEMLVNAGHKYNSSKNKAITMAFDKNNIDIAKFLISQGVNLSDVINDDNLKEAVINNHTQAIGLYLENKNSQNNNYNYLIGKACEFGKVDILKEIISHGIKLKVENSNSLSTRTMHSMFGTECDDHSIKSITALTVAINKGRKEVIKLLFEQDKNVFKNEADCISSIYSIMNKKDDVVQILQTIRKCDSNIDLSHNDNELIKSAIKADDTRMIYYLISKGVVVKNARDKLLTIALDYGASLNNINKLIENGAPYKYYNFQLIRDLKKSHHPEKEAILKYLMSRIEDTLTPKEINKLDLVLSEEEMVQLKRNLLNKEKKQQTVNEEHDYEGLGL